MIVLLASPAKSQEGAKEVDTVTRCIAAVGRGRIVISGLQKVSRPIRSSEMFGHNHVSRLGVSLGCTWEHWRLPTPFKCRKTPADLLRC
ncbi:hypothetical protein CEE69_16065 [Rhodopirellula bahusiensis]|uniref:Uncharacterized protein n=1 Tax=Rhodopirellula bahusiensis TaxID=2014065 RepID=A0A2G1W561_9BACT|nr:hypothetical protein CEE69_16065 [Rhodopirellula bahusiensis]